jgi:hypothetical protein
MSESRSEIGRPERFPMLDGPSIDWRAAEEIYLDYAYLYGRCQTLDRIAERGGFGWGEVALMRKEVTKKRNRPVYIA